MLTGTVRTKERLITHTLVCVCLLGASLFAADARVKQGTVYLKNGDHVRGTFAPTADGARLNWLSPSFVQPIEFDVRGVDYVSFVGPPKKKSKANTANVQQPVNPLAAGLQQLFRALPTRPAAATAPTKESGARVQLVNDNIVFGNVVGLNDSTLIVESPRHGTVELRRDLVMEIDGVSNSASLVFDGATSLSSWESFGSDKQAINNWEISGGALTTESEGSAIYGKHRTLDRLVCEIELSGKSKPEFQVTLGANKLPRSIQSGFNLETWGSKVVLHRQSGRELRHVELELPKRVDGDEWRLALQLYFDVKKKTVTAYSGGKKVGELAMPAEDDVVMPGSGVIVRNRGSRLRVDELRIRRWSGPIRNSNAEMDMVVLNDGTWFEGAIKDFDDEAKVLVMESNGEDTQHPLANIDQLRFKRKSDIPVRPEDDDARVTYLDGGGVTGRYLKVDAEGFWLQSQISDKPIRMSIAGMANVRFATAEPPEINRRKTGLVEFFGCSFHGRVVNSKDEKELEWESVYCDKPVRFSTGAMTRVSFEPSQHDLGINRLYSELVLDNGDRIPCDVESVNEDRIVARFAGGERAEIPGGRFKALRDSREENWVYSGFKQGEKWHTWRQVTGKPFELTDIGTLHFFGPRLLAKEFKDLPDLARISFDVRFGADTSFVVGYGSDNAMHAVRPPNTYSYSEEELKKAAKQRPDSLMEVTVEKRGKTLHARGMSRVAGILGMVMGNRGMTRRTSPKTLELDDNAVAHIDVLINRPGREFAIYANGRELYRWREPSRLEGTYLHLGTSNGNSGAYYGNSEAPQTAPSTSPIVSIFNFRIARWPGDMRSDHRERFLTRRMGARRKATTHVMRAANGDSLRGQLVEVQPDAVVFKSRLRTYRIDRNKVVEIIALDLPVDDTSEDDQANSDGAASGSSDEKLTRVRLWGGGTVSLQQVRADEEMVVGLSPIVGPISVPWEAIAAIDFAGEAEPDSAFAKWVLRDPPPLPEAPPAASASQSSESPWLNKPAPEFELDLNDGRRVAIADLKGKPVVLDFWATWCGPCLASMPSMMELAEEYGDKIEFVAINLQEEPDDIKEFLEARLWDLRVGYDQDGALGRIFGVTSIPCTMVIDAEGIVRHVHVGASPTLKKDLKAVIDQL